jgi:hypothetical protein
MEWTEDMFFEKEKYASRRHGTKLNKDAVAENGSNPPQSRT